jgi:circadian clock protein KaiB
LKPIRRDVETPPAAYVLRLYITGTRPQSIRAIKNIKDFCQLRLEGRYNLQVIDLYQNPEQAAQAQVVAAPTLVKILPEPVRRLIGDMSDEKQVFKGLDIPYA